MSYDHRYDELKERRKKQRHLQDDHRWRLEVYERIRGEIAQYQYDNNVSYEEARRVVLARNGY